MTTLSQTPGWRPTARFAIFPRPRAISGASSAPASSPPASGCRPASSSCGRYIASQVGLVFLWGALLGVGTQFFLNMEIERYTLATGETAMSGFNRFWRHWGLVLAILVYFANLWPGWAMSSATLATYIFGGDARYIAVGSLIVIGASLTLAPVVYVALERLLFVKVAAVVVLMILAMWFAITPDSWRALPAGFSTGARIPVGAGIRAAHGRRGVRRRRRRAESLPEQLHPRQGLRHGPLRAAAGQPGDRRGGSGADQRRPSSSRPTPPTCRAGCAGGASPTSSRRSPSCW